MALQLGDSSRLLWDVVSDVLRCRGWTSGPLQLFRGTSFDVDPALAIQAHCRACRCSVWASVSMADLEDNVEPLKFMDRLESELRAGMQAQLCPHAPARGPGAIARAVAKEGGGL